MASKSNSAEEKDLNPLTSSAQSQVIDGKDTRQQEIMCKGGRDRDKLDVALSTTAKNRDIEKNPIGSIEESQISNGKHPSQKVKVEETATRTALEPPGSYAGPSVMEVKSNDAINIAETNMNSLDSQREGIEVSGHTKHTPIPCDEKTTNPNTHIKPNWSRNGLQFPFPRKRRSPGDNSNGTSTTQATIRLPSLLSYNSQWSNIVKSTSSKHHNDPKYDSKTISADSKNPSNNNIDSNVQIMRKEIENSKVRERFITSITNPGGKGVNITKDTSVAGRYDSKRKYLPFGFDESTKEACEREKYEVFQPTNSKWYQHMENRISIRQGNSIGFNPISIPHYQSWDPKTMQYSSRPENFDQPLAQLRLTFSSEKASKTRAYLFAAMNCNGDDSSCAIDPNATTSTSNVHQNFHHNVDDTSSRRDSGGDRFGRRHSLYLPTENTGFFPTNNTGLLNGLSAAAESSKSGRTLRNSFLQSFIGQQESSKRRFKPDTTTVEASEDHFRIGSNENPNFLNINSNQQVRGTILETPMKYRTQQGEYTYTSTHSVPKMKKKKGTPASKTKRKKKDCSPLRRSSRKKPRRNHDGDSSSSYSGEE